MAVERRLIVDTRPIVALLDPSERNHSWARLILEDGSRPLISCDAVMSGAFFFLRPLPLQTRALRQMLQDGVFDLGFSLSSEMASIMHLMQQYENVPMSLADACLVRISELRRTCIVATLDSDFLFYRRFRNAPIPIESPAF